MKLFDKQSFHIREADIQDCGKLAELHEQGFDHPWSEDEIAATLSGKGVTCFMSYIRGTGMAYPRGFLIVRSVADEAEVLSIAVASKYRKRGIGRSLLDHTIRHLHSARVRRLILEVSENNEMALKLYRSLRFEQISERKAYYKSSPICEGNKKAEFSNALVMQLELG